MGVEDRDWMRERKIDYSTHAERQEQHKSANPPPHIPQWGFMFFERLKHHKSANPPTDIPQWVFVVCGFIALAIVLWVGNHWH